MIDRMLRAWNLRFLRSEFFWASALKIFVGISSVLLFPLMAAMLGKEVSSEFALLLSQSMVYSVFGRLGADQYISQLIVNEGHIKGRPAKFLLNLAVLNAVVFFVLIFFGFVSLVEFTLVFAISFATIVGRIQIALGSGLQGVLVTSLVPLVAYYCAAGMTTLGFLQIGMLPYVAGLLIAVFSCITFVGVFGKTANPVPTKAESRNLPFFSGVTVIRSLRNESPALLASYLGLPDIWLLATAQRAVNFFGMVQVAINAVFFRHAFVESQTRYVTNWIWLYLAWLVAAGLIYVGVSAQSPETFNNVSVLDVIFLALTGLFAAMALKYGNIGIRFIHIGRVRTFVLVLLAYYVLAVMMIILLKPIAETLGQIWIVTVFAVSFFLSNYTLDKINVAQD